MTEVTEQTERRTGLVASNHHDTATGKVFITRHGERADLADERWVATTTVSAAMGMRLRVVCERRQYGI